MNNKVNFLRGTSAEYESSIKDNDTFYYTTDTKKLYLGDKEITGGGVTIDDTLSDTSKNPVQNKVVNAALNSKADQTTVDNALAQKANSADVTASLAGKSDTGHTHDDRYYTESETNTLLGDKVGVSDFNSHTNNTTVHVTAEERTRWNGKAELTDIPTTLPANGGNADTIGGLGTDVIPHGYQTLYNNADQCKKSGYYMLNSTASNIPIAAFGLLVVSNGDYADSATTWAVQTFYPTSNGGAYRRMYVNGSFTTWVNIADGGNAATANTAGTLATTASNICLRNLSSGTAEANTTNCPIGAWYGKYE